MLHGSRQGTMALVTWMWWMPAISAAALPVAGRGVLGRHNQIHARDDSRTILTDADTGRAFVPGETSTDRTIYNLVALFCAMLLSVYLGMSLHFSYNFLVKLATRS